MKRLTVVVGALVVLVVAGVAMASGTLSGKYKTTIGESGALGGFLNGTWVLNFKDGSYHVTKNGQAIVHGKDTIKGHVVTFKDAPGPGACPTKGKYKFTLSSAKLTFKRISDSTSSSCVGRVDVLKHTFTKV
jgi:hypothetical protein